MTTDDVFAAAASSAPPVAVRRFASGDREAVAALWGRVFPADPGRNEPHGMIDRKLAVDDLVWVAIADGTIVGAVAAGYDGVRGWIYHLAVDADHRRRRVGEALMRAVEDELARLGCPKVNLQVRGDNSEAVAFYESLGYAVEDRVSLGRVLGA